MYRRLLFSCTKDPRAHLSEPSVHIMAAFLALLALSSCVVCVAAGNVAAVSPAWSIDPRFIGNGSLMLEDAYLDQPYVTCADWSNTPPHSLTRTCASLLAVVVWALVLV